MKEICTKVAYLTFIVRPNGIPDTSNLYSGQQWDFGSLVVHISIVVKEGGNSTIGIYYSQDRVEVKRSNQ